MSAAVAAAFGTVVCSQPLTSPGMVRQIRAHADRLELAVLRHGSPAGGWFVAREHLPLVVAASHEAMQPGTETILVGSIPVRAGRLEVSAQRRRDGNGAVVFQVRGDDGRESRPTTIRGGELAALDRAVDLVMAVRS